MATRKYESRASEQADDAEADKNAQLQQVLRRSGVEANDVYNQSPAELRQSVEEAGLINRDQAIEQLAMITREDPKDVAERVEGQTATQIWEIGEDEKAKRALWVLGGNEDEDYRGSGFSVEDFARHREAEGWAMGHEAIVQQLAEATGRDPSEFEDMSDRDLRDEMKALETAMEEAPLGGVTTPATGRTTGGTTGSQTGSGDTSGAGSGAGATPMPRPDSGDLPPVAPQPETPAGSGTGEGGSGERTYFRFLDEGVEGYEEDGQYYHNDGTPMTETESQQFQELIDADLGGSGGGSGDSGSSGSGDSGGDTGSSGGDGDGGDTGSAGESGEGEEADVEFTPDENRVDPDAIARYRAHLPEQLEPISRNQGAIDPEDPMFSSGGGEGGDPVWGHDTPSDPPDDVLPGGGGEPVTVPVVGADPTHTDPPPDDDLGGGAGPFEDPFDLDFTPGQEVITVPGQGTSTGGSSSGGDHEDEPLREMITGEVNIAPAPTGTPSPAPAGFQDAVLSDDALEETARRSSGDDDTVRRTADTATFEPVTSPTGGRGDTSDPELVAFGGGSGEAGSTEPSDAAGSENEPVIVVEAVTMEVASPTPPPLGKEVTDDDPDPVRELVDTSDDLSAFFSQEATEGMGRLAVEDAGELDLPDG